MKFNEKLKELRKEKGLTQEELASKIYVSRTLISKYESGAIIPTKDNIEKLALFFNVDKSDLMSKEDVIDITLKNEKTLTKAKLSFYIIIISSSLLFIILLSIPIISTSRYVYLIAEEGANKVTYLPLIIEEFNNVTYLCVINSNPITIFSYLFSLINVSSSSLLIFCRSRTFKIISILNVTIFIINIIVFLFSIVSGISYASRNIYDYSQIKSSY